MFKTLAIAGATAALGISGVAFAPGASANNPQPHPRCATSLDQFNYIAGTTDADYLVGTNWSDFIRGRGGNDVLVGKECNDILNGNGGNDRIRSVDYYRDSVNGGRGTDRCVGDVFDTFTSCETVIIRSPFPSPSPV